MLVIEESWKVGTSQQTGGLGRIMPSTAKTFNVQGNKPYEVQNQEGNYR